MTFDHILENTGEKTQSRVESRGDQPPDLCLGRDLVPLSGGQPS